MHLLLYRFDIGGMNANGAEDLLHYEVIINSGVKFVVTNGAAC